MNPIKIRHTAFVDMAEKLKENKVLRMCYGPVIHANKIQDNDKLRSMNPWYLFNNTTQTRALFGILQDKNILSKDKKVVIIPSN
jgi:hypothetical protein